METVKTAYSGSSERICRIVRNRFNYSALSEHTPITPNPLASKDDKNIKGYNIGGTEDVLLMRGAEPYGIVRNGARGLEALYKDGVTRTVPRRNLIINCISPTASYNF